MTKDILSIKNKVFVITGGLGQLGQLYVNEIIKRGGRVAVIDIIEEEKIKNLSASNVINKDNFIYFLTDITNKSQINKAANTIKNKWGSVDVLINNAALDSPPDAPEEEVGPFENYPEASFDKVMNVNVKGTLFCCQVFGKIMANKKQGVIINISSIYGIGSPRQDIYDFRRKEGKTYFKPVAYSVSKSAILNLTRYLATYWAKDNVRVNTLTLAGIYNAQPKEFLNEYTKHVPIGRMAKPEETIGPILFLSSDASSYMTGSNLIIDGGWTAW
jgi:NAD(P)-dependent dehydrogenase (short-subunit alcohol dehydrogenase family)